MLKILLLMLLYYGRTSISNMGYVCIAVSSGRYQISTFRLLNHWFLHLPFELKSSAGMQRTKYECQVTTEHKSWYGASFQVVSCWHQLRFRAEAEVRHIAGVDEEFVVNVCRKGLTTDAEFRTIYKGSIMVRYGAARPAKSMAGGEKARSMPPRTNKCSVSVSGAEEVLMQPL